MKPKYTHTDWRQFKESFKLKTSDISKITGLKDNSIRTSTAPAYKYGLPKWAVLAIWVWKKSNEEAILKEAEHIKDRI